MRITRTIRVGAATPAEQAANPDSTNPGSMSDVVARAVARHRADMEKTAEAARRKQAAPDKPAAQATQKKAASAAHQAAEAARKFKGKSL